MEIDVENVPVATRLEFQRQLRKLRIAIAQVDDALRISRGTVDKLKTENDQYRSLITQLLTFDRTKGCPKDSEWVQIVRVFKEAIDRKQVK